MSRFIVVSLAVVALSFSAGCHKKMAEGPAPAVASQKAPPAAPTRASVEAELKAHFAKVYFDTDSSTINAAGKAALADAAKVMMQNADLTVEVQGHCDERGTVDYNQALGQRRAVSVRDALVAGGVAPSRVKTLSYGEEKPAVKGQGESVWSANRRGELIPLWKGSVASAF